MEISVIVPVYNSEKYLKKCMESLFAQTFQDFEVICVNDGSIDGSLAILQEYQKHFPEQLVVTTIENGGQANARNVGIDLAKGKYVMFVDSDDTIRYDMLEGMWKRVEEADSDMGVCEIQRVFEEKPSLLERHFQFDTAMNITKVTTIYDHPEIICYLTGAPYAKLIKRQFLNDYGIRFIKGYIYEDQVFTQTILSCNPTMVFTKEKYYEYLVRANSTMTSKKSRVADMFVSYRNLYDAYVKQGREKEFKKELDYLCLYHVMIGTAYRMWRSGQFGLRDSLRQCRVFANDYHCVANNRYMKRKGWLCCFYLAMVYHE